MRFSTCGAVGVFAAFASFAALSDGCAETGGFSSNSSYNGIVVPPPPPGFGTPEVYGPSAAAPVVDAGVAEGGTEAGADSKASSLACNDVWERTYGANALDTELSAPSGSVPEILEFINQARSNPCTCGDQLFMPAGPLTWSKKLETAALKHSEWMAKSRTFDHVGSKGSEVDDRAKAAGYRFSLIGENIDLSAESAVVALQHWLTSAKHCANLMNPSFTEIAVAAALGAYPDDPKYAEINAKKAKTYYWTMVLAAPKESAAPKKK